MSRKIKWTRIDTVFHGFQYLTEQDKIFYHIEYSRGGFEKSKENNWILNYKKDIKHRNEKQWYYKEVAINQFADLIITTGFETNSILLAGATSKRRDSVNFDSRNEEVLKIVNDAIGIPISFNLESIKDVEPVHLTGGYRSPDKLIGLYKFTPFEIVPEIVYIVDDVITSGSHFVVWRDLIKQEHPDIEVRGIYLARTVDD